MVSVCGVCVCARVRVCVCVCMCVCCRCVCVCLHARVFVCECTHVGMPVGVHVRMHAVCCVAQAPFHFAC